MANGLESLHSLLFSCENQIEKQVRLVSFQIRLELPVDIIWNNKPVVHSSTHDWCGQFFILRKGEIMATGVKIRKPDNVEQVQSFYCKET